MGFGIWGFWVLGFGFGVLVFGGLGFWGLVAAERQGFIGLGGIRGPGAERPWWLQGEALSLASSVTENKRPYGYPNSGSWVIFFETLGYVKLDSWVLDFTAYGFGIWGFVGLEFWD